MPGWMPRENHRQVIKAITSQVIEARKNAGHHAGMMTIRSTFPDLLRQWRGRRRLSQLALAAEAGLSQRHLSFLECGKAQPSREMALRLADQLALPPRERNALLAAAGFSPQTQERAADHPDLAAAMEVVGRILDGHAPHPALAVDRNWNLVRANAPALALLEGVAPHLLAPPVNVLRVSLHPDGLAPRIRNYREWRAHLLERLGQQADMSGDAEIAALVEELGAYPVPTGAKAQPVCGHDRHAGIAVPLELLAGETVLSFLSTTTVFGTALDIFLSELVIESFFPADAATAAAMTALSASLADEAPAG